MITAEQADTCEQVLFELVGEISDKETIKWINIIRDLVSRKLFSDLRKSIIEKAEKEGITEKELFSYDSGPKDEQGRRIQFPSIFTTQG